MLAETLLVLTSDYTTACLSFSRHYCQVSSNDTTFDAFRSVARLVHSQLAILNTFFVIAAMFV